MMRNRIYLIFLLVSIGNSAANLQFTADPEAVCLDGTKGSYYYEAGSGSGADKFLIFFQGGAWISGVTKTDVLNDAYWRSKGNLGSSKFYSAETTFSGIFSRDNNVNPEFYNWNYIVINYCDGTGYQGYVKEPYVVNGEKIYFRGEKITKSILNAIYPKLASCSKVLISGCSAGGLAAFTWLQYFREILPNTVEVYGAPDSGVFLDYQPYDKSISYRQLTQEAFMQVSNVEVDPPNKQCVLENADSKWKCLFAQYLVRYITVPIFFVQSPYDSWCIGSILRLSCSDDYTLKRCNKQQTQYIEEHAQMYKDVMNGRIGVTGFDGAFAPSCLWHCFIHSWEFNAPSKYTVPGGSGYTISASMIAWLYDKDHLQSHSHIDSVSWPGNPGCNNL